jgi:hypothetical protein
MKTSNSFSGKATLILLLSFLMIHLYCSKDKIEIRNSSNNNNYIEAQLRSSTTLLVNPTNGNNPIDSVGQIHNEILDYIAFHPGFDTIDIIAHAYDYVQNSKNWDDMSEYMSQYSADTLGQSIWDFCNDDDLEGLINYVSSMGGLSQALINELNNLFSVLDFNDENVSASEIIDSLKQIESNFAESTEVFTLAESRTFYGTASVLRYSIAYWFSVSQDDNHPYYTYIADMIASYNQFDNGDSSTRAPFPWRKLWRALTVVAADAAGFAGGYALGSGLSMGNPAVGGSCGIFFATVCSGLAKEFWDPSP